MTTFNVSAMTHVSQVGQPEAFNWSRTPRHLLATRSLAGGSSGMPSRCERPTCGSPSALSLRHLVRDEVLYRDGSEAATRSSLNKWLMQGERRAVLEPDGALHRLRHTFCSRLARKGAPAKAISDLAGHASFSTTARYIHLFAGEKESAIALLDATEPSGEILEKFNRELVEVAV